MKNLCFLVLFLGFGMKGMSQEMPGGIGSGTGSDGKPHLQMWYEASDIGLSNNSSVTSWADKSGNGRNITQVTAAARPTMKTAADANYSFDAVRFDGTDDFLNIDGSVITNTDYTVVAVAARRTGGRNVIMGGATGSTNQNFHPYFNSSTLNLHHWGNDYNVAYSGGAGSTANGTTPNFGVFVFNLSSTGREMFQNGTSLGTDGSTSQLTSYSGAALGRIAAINEFSDLDIAELIVYSDDLNFVEMVILQNYLSSKYDIPMDANDFYAGDTPGNGNYDYQVAGIGANGGQELRSNSSLDLTIEVDGNPTGYGVLFGNNGAANAVSTANLGSGVAQRWARTWYIDEIGAANVKVEFDFSEHFGNYPSGDPDNYVLLRWSGSSYDIVSIAAVDKNAVGSKIIFDVADASLTDGIYTLGTVDATDSPVTGSSNQTWYSYASGNWSNPATWTLDGGVIPDQIPAGGGIPSSIDDVVITSGRTVTMDLDDVTVGSVEVVGELDLGTTHGHDFNTITGSGTIHFAGYNPGGGVVDNFPAGETTQFADSLAGGTVRIYGTGLSLNQNRTFNDVIVDLNSTSNIAILTSNYRINGDLSLEDGVFQINDNSSTTVRSLDIYHNFDIRSSASVRVGTGNTASGYSIPGAMPAAGAYHGIYHQINIYGDFNNSGSARFSNLSDPVYNQFTSTGGATVTFKGRENKTAYLNGVTDFYNLVVDKGTDQTYTLEINSTNASNFRLLGANNVGRYIYAPYSEANPEVRKALFIKNGTLKLTGRVNIPSLSEGSEAGGNGDYAIGANGYLWIDGTNVSVYSTASDASQSPGSTGVNTGSGNQALSVYGKFRISNGFFGTRNSAGLIFWTAVSGEVQVDGGTVNVSQLRTANGGTGENSYIQTGGNVYVRGSSTEPGEVAGEYALFSMHLSESVFRMTGGNLYVSGARGLSDQTGNASGQYHGGGLIINSDEGKYEVTGGTIHLINNTNDNFIISSRVPLWNVEMSKTGGSATQIDMQVATAGGGGAGEYSTVDDPILRVLNDLTIGSGVEFDHNGFNVEVGSDFTVANGGSYLYDGNKHNTLTINGTDNSLMSLLNIDGGGNPGEQQVFYNLIIDKPHNKTVSLASGKTGSEYNGFQNNLFRVNGEAFKVLGGTLDQGRHSILANCDTLVNYDVLTVYNRATASTDANFNGNNDQLKMASNQGTPTNIVVITADTAVIGNLKYYMQDYIVDINSDLHVQYLEYSNGRLNIQDNNLKIDYFDESKSFTRGAPSVSDMIVTNGEDSDGGISLYISGNNTYKYHFGLGLTNSEPTSRYTPGTVNISDFVDDGYITIRPVDQVLGTTVDSGDILSYYWKVDYTGFSTLPTVTYTFKYYDNDLDGSGNEGNFVAGKVLDVVPFTRNFEDDGIPENEGVNTSSNIITFNGPADSGFTLETASYTAGENPRFVGAPEVFYNTFSSIDNWNDGTKWTSNSDGSDDGVNAYPQAGDIAIMQSYGLTNDRAWVYANVNINVAKLIFDNSAGGWLARLWMTKRNATHNFGIVSGAGALYFEATSNQIPNITDGSDLGLFSSNLDSYFIYKMDVDNADVDMLSNIDEYPNLRIEAGNGPGDDDNRILYTTIPIVVNGELRMDRSSRLIANHDITVRQDLRVTWQENRCTFEIGDDREVTITVEGDLRLEDGNGNDDSRFIVKNDNQAGYEHKVRIGGNLVVESVNAASSTFDLYNGAAPNNNAILEFINDGSVTYSNASTIIPDLYRIVVNKTNPQDIVSMDGDFDLNGPTSGVGQVKAIELIRGTFVLNHPDITVNLNTGDDNFRIPAGTTMDVTQGKAFVSGNSTGIYVDGTLAVSGANGELNMDISDASNPGNGLGQDGNNYIEYSASGSASMVITDGTLTVGSQIRRSTIATTGILNYEQTGGQVVVGKNNPSVADRGVFEVLNSGSRFVYTGGSLTLVKQNSTSPSVAALMLLPTEFDVQQPINIGNADTPVGQDNFGINANIPLDGLNINGTNSPTAFIRVNELTLTGDLVIDAGATLDAAGIKLILESNFANDGTFVPSTNTTEFNSDQIQVLSGTGTTEFYNLSKYGAGELQIQQDIPVTNLLRIAEGIMNDGGNDISLSGDAIIDGTHQSSGGNGLIFEGSIQQRLYRTLAGTSDLGVVTINNANGVVIPEGNGYNFNVNNELRMQNGVFNIGSALITIGQNANITPVSAYSVSNMMKTNSSFADNGVRKIFPAGYTTDFIYPIGESKYTPVTIDLTGAGYSSGTSVGSITVRPANEYHPAIDEGSDFFASGDINNVLHYYWTLEADNLSSFVGNAYFQYDQSDVKVAEGGYSEADYIAAQILYDNNPSNNISKFTTAEVDEVNNIITYDLTGSGAGITNSGISGDYFAGIDQAIPNNIATYISQTSGDVDQPIYDQLVPGGGAPRGAILIVDTGDEVTFELDDINLYRTEIREGATLTVDGTTGHRLGIISGTGNLKIVSNTSSASLPAGDYGDFFSCSGGGLEYAGTGSYSILGGITNLRNLSLTGSGQRNFPNNNITICEDFLLDGPEVYFQNDRRLDVENDLIINSGVLENPSGYGRITVYGNFQINGGEFKGAYKGYTYLIGDATISSGTLRGGNSQILYTFKKFEIQEGGTFIADNSSITFQSSSSNNYNSEIIGDFTGVNSFNKIRINKIGSQNRVNVRDNIEITESVLFSEGNMYLDEDKTVLFAEDASATPAAGLDNSYIDGKVSKTLATAGESFIFPIGNGGVRRPATVSNVSTGGLSWEAQYFLASPMADSRVDNLTPTNSNIKTLSNIEYWVISDGSLASTGENANVGLSWGMASDVSTSASEREELEVMVWNDGTSSWDNYGGGTFSGGHTQSYGTFSSTSKVSFSEHVFTLGSGDEANPLPVTLRSFTGENKGLENHLYWTTVSEINNSHFELERSSDGETFQFVAEIDGSGTTNDVVNYSYVDHNPVFGVNYYRLKQIDFDGTTTTIKTIVRLTVDQDVRGINLVTYPNPTSQNNINIRVATGLEAPVMIKMYDLYGRPCYVKEFEYNELSQDIKLDVNGSLKQGIYIISAEQGVIKDTKKVMILSNN
ncbi:T9SS type A sorting domain-containing protein [Fulvivirga ligni]|uniref:T9SS type A sorting domain-containing protein n=1 Tax=Fulvivirga ligni TaxID=2904246 RepID=UPI001F463C10|nr:T9SS type A sorting domain-containing protein [Fulvivirga ligni]UII23958.1 T9SS type A sorting domain-containing protein [Fulvivirga ligni]